MPSLKKVVLALGSNLGDRASNLQSALNALIAGKAVTSVSASRIYETEPVGGPDQGPYLNAVISGLTTLQPEELLTEVHRIENELGRVRTVHWGPRTIDIDILAYEDEVVETNDLVIPHPRAHERAFVLLPWSELDAEFEIPGHGTVADCLARLSTNGIDVVEGSCLLVLGGDDS